MEHFHAAALDFVVIHKISGSNLGPDFGEGDNPSRNAFKTKADLVKFVQEAVANGAKVIQQQGDTALWPACGLLSCEQPGCRQRFPKASSSKP